MKRLNYTLLTIMLVAFGMVGVNAQDITHADDSFTVTQGTTVNYYDNGGPGCDDDTDSPGEYIADSDETAVICPDVAGSTITIEFLDVDVETRGGTVAPCWDFINIYDGDSDAAPLLISGCGEEGFASCAGLPGDGSDAFGVEGSANDIDGSNAPSPVNNVFTSTASNGCLTVNFTSDGSVQQGGWVATVSASAVGGGPTCDDGIQNGDETGVDCGGSCEPCVAAPTCDDGIQNGDETGVDCGGSCAPCVVTCETFNLDLDFDNFSSETSWEMVDLSGTLVDSESYSAGLDATTETFCLDPGCYEYTIFDSFGDGICCGFGNGSYTLSDSDGGVVASGGDFGGSETSFFCTAPPADCVAPTASATVVPYCNNGVFMVLVNLGSTGSANALTIANTGGQPALQNVVFPRRYFVGPFQIGEEVDIRIYDQENTACITILEGLTDNCNSSLFDAGNLTSETTLNEEISVFPNPTAGDVNVNLGSVLGQEANIRIMNAVGQLIEERQIGAVENVTERFDLSNQQAGMYFIHVDVAGGDSHVERVILGTARP
ncbi:MAG: T9SS type A sorting domain-containing protein [Phaeodactylibacter sp.]|uniref:T9SS type A sorting domain-containing protein n=1 Tax=Phaeodactylibacter sp. TaxID=1940289 RepID=UPI0032EDAAC2